jgi:hypothetical protein
MTLLQKHKSTTLNAKQRPVKKRQRQPQRRWFGWFTGRFLSFTGKSHKNEHPEKNDGNDTDGEQHYGHHRHHPVGTDDDDSFSREEQYCEDEQQEEQPSPFSKEDMVNQTLDRLEAEMAEALNHAVESDVEDDEEDYHREEERETTNMHSELHQAFVELTKLRLKFRVEVKLIRDELLLPMSLDDED